MLHFYFILLHDAYEVGIVTNSHLYISILGNVCIQKNENYIIYDTLDKCKL